MTFAEWMAIVDDVLEQTVDLCSYDMPDQPWHDWYSDGITPATAARIALAREGFTL